MAESFKDALQRDILDIREAFHAAMTSKTSRRKPKRVGMKPKYGTLAALRNWRIAVREAALRRVQISMRYKKATTGEVKIYIVAPYSYRYRRTSRGFQKMLFAYDMSEKHIKGFVTRNIQKIALTDRKFVPKWPVEIA